MVQDCEKPTNFTRYTDEVEQQLVKKAICENKSDLYLNRPNLEKKITAGINSSNACSDEFTIFESKKVTSHKHRRGAKSGRNSRASKFRGVSKNGSKYQVFIMINKKKRYFGVLEDEIHSAHIYDKLAIIFHGQKVKLY